MDTKLTPIVIAVMGVTGAGKSYFVQRATGANVKIGDGQVSCTHDVKPFSLVMEPYVVHMVDTPGFDDPFATDAEILQGIAKFLRQVYHERATLSGILYLHQITDARMKGSALKNLDMFQKLMGTTAITNCILVTTKWGLVDPAIGQTREKELKRDPRFWANMIAHKARVEIFDGSTQSAIRIIQSISGLPGITTLLTEGLCWYNKQLGDTRAGQVVNVTLEKQLAEKQEEIEITKREKEEAILQKDVQYAKELVAAHSKASDHHILRNVGRVVGGVGTTAIIVTSGYAAPVVLGTIGVVENAYDEQEATDKKIITNLQATLKG